MIERSRSRGSSMHLMLVTILCLAMLMTALLAAPLIAAPPIAQPPARATPKPRAGVSYNLPSARLSTATGLYASPNRAELIVAAAIPAGSTIYIMGRNATSSHLRVVWNTGVGWVPVSFTSYNGQREKLARLPVFEHEPPRCAVPLTTQFGLSSQWNSTSKQRIAIVVDLFRSKFGAFPKSSLALTVNSRIVETSRRPIVESGQFSLKDIVLTLPQAVQSGDVVGYRLETTSDEPLTFMATIFQLPQNCKWDVN